MGRFINADAFTTTGQGLLGNNMFAYCNNNPVCNSDPTGYLSAAGGIGNPNAMMRGGGCYKGGIIPDTVREVELLEKQANDIFNTNESAVISAKHYAFYKGKLIIKVPFMDMSAFSFGAIFMGSNIRSSNILRHEFGHTQQLEEIGLLGYTVFVVAPSVTCFWLTEFEVLPTDQYYSYPWEYIANIYGNADGKYAPWADASAKIYWSFATIASQSG